MGAGTVTVAGVMVSRGQEAFGHLNVGVLAGGTECRIGFRVINGAGSGPTLGLISVLHGWEPMGAEIIRRALLDVDPETLRGTVIAVPIANPFAMEFGGSVESSGTAVNPSDHLNLNQVFPGKEQFSWLTEQIAFYLHREVLQQADVLLDFHDGTGASVMLPVAIFPDFGGRLGDQVTELTRAFGAPVSWKIDPPAGSILAACGTLGKVAMSPHVAGLGIVDDYVDQGAACLRNTMAWLNMIDAAPWYPERQIIVENYLLYRSEEGGFFESEPGLKLGAIFEKDQVLARIIDPLTNEVQEVCRAPFRGMVTLHRMRLPINPGGYVCHLADLDSIVWERGVS